MLNNTASILEYMKFMTTKLVCSKHHIIKKGGSIEEIVLVQVRTQTH
jgi:hypothetical protein